jgi:hypothetical protein
VRKFVHASISLLYNTFKAGQTTNCVITPSTTANFTITSNITGSLATCQHWGLTISGGVAPYKITLASIGARVVTNVTLPSSDNHFTYVNRAAPGAQLLGLVHLKPWMVSPAYYPCHVAAASDSYVSLYIRYVRLLTVFWIVLDGGRLEPRC